MTTKVCSKCKVEKDVGEFYKDRTARDGLQYKCKSCARSTSREWRVENREKFKKDIFKWRAKNQERVRELSRKSTLRSTERLTDYYVKLKLGVPNPPQELIELKRLQLQIHRELKQQGEVNNINEMREELCKVFASLKDGTLSAKEAKEMNNCMGKIINTLKVEIEYAQICKTEANIPFMNYGK